ncbi:MAG: ROK family protein [Clostridiales bacterium]|jgi:glucokinase|nr:ROK family protein [Clostridiales bacterium]
MLQIGFDVGGSNIAVGVVDDDMRIVARRSAPFPTGEPYSHTVGIMAGFVRALAKECGVDARAFQSIGIAVPGNISSDEASVVHAYNLQFHHVPLRAAMQSHFPSVPVYLGNDADVAAVAELYAGAFKGRQTAVLITLGTGIGGGLIVGGRMFKGGRKNGVELGHMVLAHNGPMCTCGTRGCVEALCTATWLTRQGRISVIEYPKAMISTKAGGDMNRVSARLVIDCAKAGDAIAGDIFARYVDQLGSALASVANLIDPEVIALGGGVSLAGEFLFAPLRENTLMKCFFDTCGDIVPAQMGNDAGIIGAAMLQRQSG